MASGKFLPKSSMNEGPYPVYGGNGINGYHDKYLVENPSLVIGRVGEYCGIVHLTKPDSWVTDNALIVSLLHEANPLFLLYYLNQINLNRFAKVGGQPSISQSSISGVVINLPSIQVQNDIVNELEKEISIVVGNKKLIELFEKKINAIISRVWGE